MSTYNFLIKTKKRKQENGQVEIRAVEVSRMVEMVADMFISIQGG